MLVHTFDADHHSAWVQGESTTATPFFCDVCPCHSLEKSKSPMTDDHAGLCRRRRSSASA